MFYSVNSSAAIFNSREYLNDISRFNVIELIKEKPMFLLSNNFNFIIAMISEKLPIWVWTSDKINDKTVDAICDEIIDKVKELPLIKICCKQRVVDTLTSKIKNKNVKIIERKCLECNKIISHKKPKDIVRPTMSDLSQISENIIKYENECYDRSLSHEIATKAAEKSIGNPCFYVIKEGNTVICFGRLSKEINANISIEGIYTVPEYRNQGCAANMAACLGQIAINKGKTAVLLTDINNYASNKAYKNVGFTECGSLYEIEITNHTK